MIVVMVIIDKMMGEGTIIDTSVNLTTVYVPSLNVESILVVP